MRSETLVRNLRVSVIRRFRLDLCENGIWSAGEPRYDTFEEAFDAGLLWATGQTEAALELPPGLDFRVVSEWVCMKS